MTQLSNYALEYVWAMHMQLVRKWSGRSYETEIV